MNRRKKNTKIFLSIKKKKRTHEYYITLMKNTTRWTLSYGKTETEQFDDGHQTDDECASSAFLRAAATLRNAGSRGGDGDRRASGVPDRLGRIPWRDLTEFSRLNVVELLSSFSFFFRTNSKGL